MNRNARCARQILLLNLLAICLCAGQAFQTTSAHAQEWSQTYGDGVINEGRSMQVTSDGGFILLGFTYSVNEANRVFADATVYPNPTTDYFLVSGLEANTVWTGRLVDISGSLVRDLNGTGSTRIELAGIKRGLYFLQLTSSATASTTLRVIIQ